MIPNCTICKDRFVCFTQSKWVCKHKCDVCGQSVGRNNTIPLNIFKAPDHQVSFICLSCAKKMGYVNPRSAKHNCQLIRSDLRYHKKKISFTCKECPLYEQCSTLPPSDEN